MPNTQENLDGAVPDNKDTSTTSGSQTTDNADVNSFAARVQIPQLNAFSLQGIESWFTRLEAFFRINNFGKLNQEQRDSTKFNIAVMYMDERLHEQAYDIVRNPPNKDKYETLRQTILNKFSVSPIARLEQLTSGIQLGDSKPSHMLTQLQRTGVTTDKQLIKDFWLQKLPVSARAVITGIDKGNTDMTLEQLASIADEIIDVVRANSTNAVTVRSQQEQTTPTTKLNGNSSMETRISRIERALSRIELSNRRRRSSRPRSHSRSGETGHSSEGMQQKNCWYHRRFGDKAQKCETPCNFKTAKN
ncbi:PREDICTED: uncharacterized protein LOC108374052 [Rhagoletis zephyria]|uniref:uncharacterized protein LOC108374052 n=1 Tax=Rhagoletis zephyria TaxID=28612 RepID=UPI000811834B|nr:PREDICTED: uncharacterized protein LOC108374052 [Rhagoletis zephyria]